MLQSDQLIVSAKCIVAVAAVWILNACVSVPSLPRQVRVYLDDGFYEDTVTANVGENRIFSSVVLGRGWGVLYTDTSWVAEINCSDGALAMSEGTRIEVVVNNTKVVTFAKLCDIDAIAIYYGENDSARIVRLRGEVISY
jgi:hypothetical protein